MNGRVRDVEYCNCLSRLAQSMALAFRVDVRST